MKLLKLLNPENVSKQEAKEYRVREAVRAIVFDDQNHIAVLNVSRDKYYKFPGGGIEAGEDHLTALKRECLEEIGCNIEVIGKIGKIVEYRKFCNLKQTSYCYIAQLVGEKGKPHLMPDEIEEGFEEMWVAKEKALDLLVNNTGVTLESREYIVPRDITFYKLFKNL